MVSGSSFRVAGWPDRDLADHRRCPDDPSGHGSAHVFAGGSRPRHPVPCRFSSKPIDPKTEQVGPKTYLLSNPGYTEAVTEVGDEVFLFDATQGEGARKKKDAEVIAKLFPGYKKLTVVITDLAWAARCRRALLGGEWRHDHRPQGGA